MKQEDGQDIDSLINSIFEVTGQNSDFVPASEVEDAWKSYGKGFTVVKMRCKLKQFHDPKSGRAVYSIVRRVNKVSRRVWVGIKLRDHPQDEVL